MGEPKTQRKVRIGWEFPTETRVFKEESGEQPFVLSKEFSLSMHEKANLRKMISSWRGKPITDEEAKVFDISKLIGTTCLISVVHKQAKNGNAYPEITAIATIPKGMPIPEPVNKNFILSFDEWDQDKFDSLPDFIKDKIRSSAEYKNLQPKDGDFARAKDFAQATEKKKAIVTDPMDLPF